MKITYDPAKRAWTLANRGLDFEDTPKVFAGPVYEIEDVRWDYGERRIICFGVLNGRMVTVGYVQRGAERHIFTMRKTNEKEQKRFRERLR